MQETNHTEESFIQQINKIFDEREVEFQKREAAYQKKYKNLQNLIHEMSGEREALDKKSADLEEKMIRLERQEEELSAGNDQLEKKTVELEKREKQLVLSHSLELEELKNEKIRLKRLADEYEYKLTLMDCGVADAVKNVDTTVDLEQYMLKSEHEEEVNRLCSEQEKTILSLREEYKESMRKVLAEKEELEQETETLRIERVNLLKQNLELSGTFMRSEEPEEAETIQTDLNGTDRVPKSGTEAKDEKMGEVISEPDTMIPDTDDIEDIITEELTAPILKRYIEKNADHFSNLEIHHSDEGELLYAESGGLQYHFLFSMPSRFDITATRRNSAALRRKLKDMNEKNPEIKFIYEDGEVHATGYFTNEIEASLLIMRVEEISHCFRQE